MTTPGKLTLMLMLAACAAGMASACDLNINTDGPGSGDVVTFTCEIDPLSKVDVSYEGKTTWEVGDEILINAGANGNTRETVTLQAGDISADGKKATISVSIPPYEHKHYQTGERDDVSTYYAMYPASAVAPLPLYYNQAFSNTNAMLMAGCNKDNTIVFYNVCGLISFTVTGNFDSYVFSGNNEETVAYEVYQCRVRDLGDGPTLTSPKTADSYKTLVPLQTVSGTVNGDGSTLNFIYIPNGVSLTQGFTLKLFKNGTLTKIARSSNALSVGRNGMKRLGSLDSHLEDPSESEAHESDIPTEGAVDLCSVGTANCYVVTEPGVYKIKAVKGNGTTSVGSVVNAEVLWETWCNGEAVTAGSVVKAADCQDGWIYFQIPDNVHPGNALIAAKNSNGAILWSWHIWVPESMFTAEAYDFTAAPRMMSRNLGALVDTETGTAADPRSFGLLYQWGRKDPFPGAMAAGATEQATLAGSSISIVTGKKSQDEAAAIPTTLINESGDWCSTADKMYWGDLERDSNAAKTIYDPCPVGYRTPARSKYTIFTTAGSSLNGFSYDAGNCVATIGSPKAVFPICGYMKASGTRVAGEGIVWNTRNDWESNAYAYCMSIAGGETKKGQKDRACAGSVRCVKEDADPFENAPGMPVQQSGYTRVVFDSNVEELSGICFSKDRDFIWGVGDEGAIYKISLDFKTVTTHLATGSDLEDVTMNPNTGDLYFAKEADRVDKCLAPNYSSKSTAFYVEAAANFGNSGLEGIAYYKNDVLYVGSQSGANLWAYKLDGTLLWNKKLGTLAADIQEVGGLCYDAEKDWLWVTDSEAHKLFVFDGEVTKLLAIYDVSSIGNAESVLVDRPNGCVYVGDDGTTSKIYTYKFTNL